MAHIVMTYIVMAYRVIAYIVMAHMVLTHTVMAYTVMAYIVMAYIVIAYIVIAYIVMAHIVMTHTVRVYIVMVQRELDSDEGMSAIHGALSALPRRRRRHVHCAGMCAPVLKTTASEVPARTHRCRDRADIEQVGVYVVAARTSERRRPRERRIRRAASPRYF